MKKTSIQFEIWEECNNQCKFCFLGSGNRYSSDDVKLNSLTRVMNKISDESLYDTYNIVSYIGGDFFQGQLKNEQVHKLFMDIMDKTAYFVDIGKLIEVWINATLTIGDQADLYETLNKFKDKSKIWICTSYDTIGRYHTDKMFENWDYHMKNLKKIYPEININVSTIVTGDLIDKYLDDQFSFLKFQDEYDCTMFLKTPGTPTPATFPQTIKNKKYFNENILNNFFPTRSKFLKFLAKYKQEVPEYIYDKLYNINYRADDLYKNTINNKNEYVHLHRVKNKKMADYKIDEDGNISGHAPENVCGHSISYAPYVDSDQCFICDKDLI